MNTIVTLAQPVRAPVPPSVQLEFVDCPMGCAENDEVTVQGHDLLHGVPGEFKVLRCSSCGLQRTSPRPTPGTIGAYYPDDYGPYRGTRVSSAGSSDRSVKARLMGLAKRIFDTKAHALPKLQPGRMLEIGCASGSFLHEMAHKGWQVEGIEYAESAAQAARALGYVVDAGALETVDKPPDNYDLIVGWMVLEHLHQPVESLRKLATWARRDATLALSVPNIGSRESRIFGKRWYALQLPTHLFHYDTATIVSVLHSAGWQVVRIHHHRTVANLVASSGYWMPDRGLATLGERLIRFPETGGRLGALLTFPFALPLALLGQTGRMTVWAKRAC